MPLSLKLAISVSGIAVAGFGMSRFLNGGTMGVVFFPSVIGACMIYLAGYERSYFIDKEGVWRDSIFWGQHKSEVIRWNEIADVRLILNKGKSIYLISHALRPVWPLTFNPSQKNEVVALLRESLGTDDVSIEDSAN